MKKKIETKPAKIWAVRDAVLEMASHKPEPGEEQPEPVEEQPEPGEEQQGYDIWAQFFGK